MADDYSNFLVSHAAPVALSLQTIRKETTADSTLQQIRQSGKWLRIPDLRPYSHVKKALSTVDGNGLHGRRIVMPGRLRKQTLLLAHEGHPGIVKTKQLVREKVWLPGIDKQIEEFIGHCLACQAQAPSVRTELVQMFPMPAKPWEIVMV